MRPFNKETRERLFGESQAVAAHKAARAELERVAERDGEETDDFLEANAAAAEAEKRVPRWRR